MRPIVSAVGSATYSISKFVSNVLTPYVRQTSSYIRNTTDLLDKLQDVRISDDEILVSFDVKSLYTNVPRDDAFEAIREIVQNDPDFKENNGIEPETLLDLLKVSMSTTSFQFRNKHYELTDGLPMGSPAPPVIAYLFMAKVEENALATVEDKPKIWYHFVDDVLSIVKVATLDKLRTHLNSQHPTIEFTVEREKITSSRLWMCVSTATQKR